MAQEPDPQPTGAVALTLERSGDAHHPVIEAAGEIDVATSPLLRAELAEALEQGPDTVTLDLARVSFIDSSGLGVLVGALKRLREHQADATLRVVHTQDAVRKVFDITGLDELFELRG
ncbi:MAG TPA: STAS domain-containing protein [Acidimicrobiia bacterium]|nr:STAS domain-containing protein [Acidimicrobiia bacterium]